MVTPAALRSLRVPYHYRSSTVPSAAGRYNLFDFQRNRSLGRYETLDAAYARVLDDLAALGVKFAAHYAAVALTDMDPLCLPVEHYHSSQSTCR